jgi:hypothetical protein
MHIGQGVSIRDCEHVVKELRHKTGTIKEVREEKYSETMYWVEFNRPVITAISLLKGIWSPKKYLDY